MIARSCNPSSDGSIRMPCKGPHRASGWLGSRGTVIPSDIIIFDFCFRKFRMGVCHAQEDHAS
jgi:hypothetical protein